jgi:hypothetical protein
MITAAVANRTPMASIDAAWLGMEDPTNLMMMTGVMTLDGRVDLKRLRLILDRRLMHEQAPEAVRAVGADPREARLTFSLTVTW